MTKTIMFIPTTLNVGIRTIAYGFLDTLLSKNVRAIILPAFDDEKAESLFAQNRIDDFLEEIVIERENAAEKNDVVIVCGFSLAKPYAAELNFAIATALDAAIIFGLAPGENFPQAMRQLRIVANPYQYRYERQILGVIANKMAPQDSQLVEKYKNTFSVKFPFLGVIPYRNELSYQESEYHSQASGSAISKYFDLNWLWPFLNNVVEQRITPPMFRQKLISLARQANKKIVLPEGDEPRTLQAANICAERGIAQCILLGQKEKIAAACSKINIKLDERITIIEPSAIAEKYVEPLIEARRGKGLTQEAAREYLQDTVVLGTMMLHLGEVDGLVSGAVHTTANTIRPALQIIKTAPDAKQVSSIFFMCLPDQVLVYGDCAITPNPTEEELADIAIQSAQSAQAFGIPARVAMLSYSTGTSGFGPAVDKVVKATEIAKAKRPDLDIEGPLQYDAAVDKGVAALKLPNSRVAGKATVLVVPSLEVGNIAYKAVQRSTGIICIGPMLQGLRKPVNDLSRGCLVEDIVFTIALTAVQAVSD